MSSSVSLDTSADLNSWASTSYSGTDDTFDKRFTSDYNLGFVSRRRIKAISKHGVTSKSAGQQELAARRNSEELYKEIDERMSRNSFEYPDAQAGQVRTWLDSNNNMVDASKSKSVEFIDEQDDWGNVIGIRGYPGSHLSAKDRFRRSNYHKLKNEHMKLQSECARVREQLEDTINKLKSSLKQKEKDINTLKAMISKRTLIDHESTMNGNEIRPPCGCCMNKAAAGTRFSVCREHLAQIEQLKQQLAQLELRFSSDDKHHADRLASVMSENKRMREQAEASKHELEGLANQVRVLSMDSNSKQVLLIRNENHRLKDANELDAVEVDALREELKHLEAKFSDTLREQKDLGLERDDEVSRLMVELCRLQVYQSKLEIILETERQIKLELQKELDKLKEHNGRLKEELDGARQGLNSERARCEREESVEIDRIQTELVRWQDKCIILKREKADMNDLVRSLRSKVDQIDGRLYSELSSARESAKLELDRMGANLAQLESERNSLSLKASEHEQHLATCELDKQRLENELVETRKKLEIALGSENVNLLTERKLLASENQHKSLLGQLKEVEERNGQLVDELERLRRQMERSDQQVCEFQQRFQLQQKAYDELKAKKEKELAKIRVDLNFEQYNRQVALKGVEKELRNSLRELESMKSRFSRRLVRVDDRPTEDDERASAAIHKANPSAAAVVARSATTTTTVATDSRSIQAAEMTSVPIRVDTL